MPPFAFRARRKDLGGLDRGDGRADRVAGEPDQVRAAIAAQLAAFARLQAPHEACGLVIFQRGRADCCLPCNNVSLDPLTSFEIPAAALARAMLIEAGGAAPDQPRA